MNDKNNDIVRGYFAVTAKVESENESVLYDNWQLSKLRTRGSQACSPWPDPGTDSNTQ